MTRTSLLLALVLLSGAGLLGAGIVGLVQAARAAEFQAAEAARQDCDALARGLVRAAADPRVLTLASRERRFQFAGGALLVPAELGWYDEPPRPEIERLPWSIQVLLERARHQEWAEHDAGAAAKTLAAAAGSDSEPAAAAAATVRAAWLAWRHADLAHCASLRAALARDLDTLPERELAGALLLHATVERALPPACSTLVPRLAPETAASLLARFEDHGLPTTELHAVLARASEHRRTLAIAAKHAATLQRATEPGSLALFPDLLVWHPTASGVDGALLSVEDLVARLRANDAALPILPPRAPTIVAAATLPPGAIVVWPNGLGLLPNPGAGSPWLRPWSVAVLLSVLGGCFALGLVLALRALRTERLAVQARADFLTSVTHELKTPLASIRLLAEMLDDGRVGDAAKQHEYYGLLATEAERLNTLVDNVLDLRRIERGERSYDLQLTDPNDTVRHAVELFAPAGQRDALVVHLTLDPTPTLVAIDRQALTQALLNVLDNARKYAGQGGRVTIKTSCDQGCYRIEVRDLGPGIAASERDAVFARFYRGHAQRDGHVPGVGLGLYLARSIVQAHGGELTAVAPADDQPGACLRLSLPLSVKSFSPPT